MRPDMSDQLIKHFSRRHYQLMAASVRVLSNPTLEDLIKLVNWDKFYPMVLAQFAAIRSYYDGKSPGGNRVDNNAIITYKVRAETFPLLMPSIRHKGFDRVFCASGNKRYMEIAMDLGFLSGVRLPDDYVYNQPYFVDQDYENPDLMAYRKYVSIHKPYVATVLDWDSRRDFNEVLMWAEEIAPYVSEIIIIPKIVGTVARIPTKIAGKSIRLGFSIDSSYGSTAVHPDEFGIRPVHLLGGSGHSQLYYAKKMNVVSADTNQWMLLAKFNAVWSPMEFSSAKNKYAPQLKDLGFSDLKQDTNYFAFELSLRNFVLAISTGLYTMPKKWREKDYGRKRSMVQDV